MCAQSSAMPEDTTMKGFREIIILCLVLCPGIAFSAPVDLFPTPVSGSTTLFPEIPNYAAVDDSYLEVPFTQGFAFKFFGQTYTSVFLNTNGGLTFGAGNPDWSMAANDVSQPAVAVFWGDMNALYASTRPHQMVYEQFPDRFVVTYMRFQDHDASVDNTASVSLYADGTIVIQYGNVMSKDILVGVFDGTHRNDQYMPVQDTYDLASIGTGSILFDDSGRGPAYNGEINNRTATFYAGGAQAVAALQVPTMTEWGMIIFAMLAGIFSVYYLGRQRESS